MNRRNFIKSSSISSFFIGTGILHPFLKAYQDSGYEMRALRGNVGLFTERGGTIGWYFDKNEAVVVDTQFPKQAAHLIDEMKKQTSSSLNYLINTHHHGDHTAGNIAFKDMANTVVAHENSLVNQQNSAKERGSEDQQLYPNKTFAESWKGEMGKETVSMLYWGPAHTNGDAVVHFENANVAHLGDLLFNRRFPYIDKGAGANIKNWIQVMDNIHGYFEDDTLIMCGHSDNGHDIQVTKKDIVAFKDYLGNVLKAVDGAIKAGKTEDQVMAMTEIDGSPEWKGKGIQRSLSAAYLELKN